MQAKCPNCETLFRLTEQQLTAANGKVRCGLCHRIFTATAIDAETQPPVVHTDENEATKIEAAENNAQLFLKTTDTETDTKTEATPETSRDLLFEDIQTNSVIPEAFRYDAYQKTGSPLATLGWSLGILLMLVTLVAEYAWFNRNQLLQHADIEPWINQFCATTGCTLDPIHRPELIKMVNRNVYTHPNIKQALMITATMVNLAESAQAYPDVEIGFSNIRGEIVTQRIFSPEEYMKLEKENLRLLEPDKPVTFGLEIKDPGKQAMTYEFNFL